MYCRLDLGRRRGDDRAEVRRGGVSSARFLWISCVKGIIGRRVLADGGKGSKKLARRVRLKR